MTLFVGDDWAEDHHDVEILDAGGKRLGRARLPEGMAGMTRLHELFAEHLDDDAVDPGTAMLAPGRVVVGIETDRGPWVAALLAAGLRCSRSIRCRWPVTVNAIRPPGRSPIPVTRARARRDRPARP